MKYIKDYLKENDKIIDIGAGAGLYSKTLSDLGYDVTAVELIKHNARKIEQLGIKTIHANAKDLNMIKDNTYDITLLLGPMYHLISDEDLLSALSEAKRITKTNGIIFVAYCMMDYAIVAHGFMEHTILEDKKNNIVDDNYNIISKSTDLYKFMRIPDIDKLNSTLNLERIKIINPDGLANYIRKNINELTEEEYQEFIKYQLSICENKYLIGSGYHTLDILKKLD
jgi:SAM-dependent methyltransferase